MRSSHPTPPVTSRAGPVPEQQLEQNQPTLQHFKNIYKNKDDYVIIIFLGS